MKVHLDGLGDIDPLKVPLPNGTEVTTRVSRPFAGRTIRQGALGRVARRDERAGETWLVVAIVGVGDVAYLRNELVPRKAGQLRYAIRRDLAWQALRQNVVVETVVGSRAWGLADADSDIDRRGVFVLPFPWTTGLLEPPSELTSLDGSETYWEVGKAVRQGLRADPNTLEMLLLPSARAMDAVGEWLLEARDCFASIEVYGTFGRYALGQLKRLGQSLRLAEHRALLLDWLKEAKLDLDAAAVRLAAEANVVAPNAEAAAHRARDYIKQLYSSMFDRGLLAERNFAALVAFAQSADHEFELPRELRPKNAYNLLRLISCASEWLRTGAPTFVVREPLRSELLAIKRGEIELPAVIERAEELAADLEEARLDAALPERPDLRRASAVLSRIREEVARRWVEGGPGPFGRGAAAVPELPSRSC